MNKNVFSILLIIMFLFWVLPVSAETLELKCDYATGCDLCAAVALISQVSRFILSIAGSLALLIFVVGGFFLLISQGNSNAVNQGKKMLFGATLGLIIVFTGWGIVNFVIAGLTGQIGTEVKVAQLFSKPWNELECVKPPKPKPPTAVPPTEYAAGFCAGLKIVGINPNQCSDASPELLNLINCINQNWQNYQINKAPEITSICDDKGCERCRDNWQPPPSCSHSQNSCHYGGEDRMPGSYASDLRSTGYTNQEGNELYKLAVFCNAKYFKYEGDHFHISALPCLNN